MIALIAPVSVCTVCVCLFVLCVCVCVCENRWDRLGHAMGVRTSCTHHRYDVCACLCVLCRAFTRKYAELDFALSCVYFCACVSVCAGLSSGV